MLNALHLILFVFSIAQDLRFVERQFQMRLRCDCPQQFSLRPSELFNCLQIPMPFLYAQLRFQNDHILRPADFHGQLQQLRAFLIHPIEIPHSAKVAWGEASGIRMPTCQVFGSGDSRAFFRPIAHQAAQCTVQFHLRHLSAHRSINCGMHITVIDLFPNVHSFSFPA